MKRILIATITLLAAHGTIAAPAAKPTPIELIQKAVLCELPKGKTDLVTKTVKKLGAKFDGTNVYTLPFTAHGRQASAISISDQDAEIYIAVFKNITFQELRAAAGIKGEIDSRETKYGTLQVSDHGKEMWTSCTLNG